VKLIVTMEVESLFLEECGGDEYNEWLETTLYDLQFDSGLKLFDKVNKVTIEEA